MSSGGDSSRRSPSAADTAGVEVRSRGGPRIVSSSSFLRSRSVVSQAFRLTKGVDGAHWDVPGSAI